MATRNIITDGDDRLLKKSRPVESFDAKLHTLLDDMAETMYQAEGVGLAAVQVGILRRVVVIDCGEGKLELINPKIIGQSGEQEEVEGCLSYPGEAWYVKRPASVIVEAQDRYGKTYRAKGTGLLARAFCHEIDHLDGIVYKQKAIRKAEIEQ